MPLSDTNSHYFGLGTSEHSTEVISIKNYGNESCQQFLSLLQKISHPTVYP